MKKAVFLDRDGVLNVDKGYVGNWEDFEVLPGVVEALGLFFAGGYELVVITNQSGIARGYFLESDYQTLTLKIAEYFANHEIHFAGFYHCPHHPKGEVKKYTRVCTCRKPAPGLILKATRDLGLDLAKSILVGDKVTDMLAGDQAGVNRLCLVSAENTDLDITVSRKVEYVTGLLDAALHLRLEI